MTPIRLAWVLGSVVFVVACEGGGDGGGTSGSAADAGSGTSSGGSTSSGGTTSSASSGGTTTSSSSGGSSGTPSTPPSTDLSFKAGFIGDDGPYFITGTVTLPGGASAGRPVQVEVLRSGDITESGNQLGPAGVTGANGTLTYKVTGLEPGTYKLGFRVDQTNNGTVNDPGDYIGFARGTAGATKATSAEADAIVVGDAPVTGVDVALGVVP